MSKKCKTVVYGIVALIAALLLWLIIHFLFFSGVFIPLIKLNGSQQLKVDVNQQFFDPGATARFRFRD